MLILYSSLCSLLNNPSYDVMELSTLLSEKAANMSNLFSEFLKTYITFTMN